MPSYKGQWVPAAILFTILGVDTPAFAQTLTLGCLITVDTAASGATAAANPALNSIVDGDAYSVTLNFNGTIGSPGTYNLTSLLLTDAAAGASEGAFISGSMTITLVGVEDQFNVQGCLIDALTCLSGKSAGS